jgi:sugar/nucleoside kinase (ribokinase family)
MCPDIISLGELLVEVMRDKINIPHNIIGASYKGPYPSGAPAIFIDSAARMSKNLQLTTGIIGVIGKDAFGKCITDKLQKDNVDISQIRVIDGITTGIAFNQYNYGGSRKFIFAKGAAGETSEKHIKESYFMDVKNLHIMGSALSISKTSREACYKAVKVAKEKNPKVIISFDPNLRSEMLDIDTILRISKPILKKTDILLPSGEEAETLAGVNGVTQSCQQLLKMGPKIIVLKQGRDGCSVFTINEPDEMKVEGFKVIERDPTGAGDSFSGAFIVGYLAGWNLKQTARFANAVGALKVKSFGPMSDTTYEEVIDMMKRE